MPESPDKRVFLGLGGNLGLPLVSFQRARQRLAAEPMMEILASSALYQTLPIGGPAEQPDYINGVLEIRTGLSPQNLLHLCHSIEDDAGRTRTLHWGPRTLDIDLLSYDNLILSETDLILPHPRLHQRHFVLLPLCDLAPDWIHPLLKMPATALLNRLGPPRGIKRIEESW